MPTLSHIVLPVPKSWDELEDIVASAIDLQGPQSPPQRFGRLGQSQDGVDIFYEDSFTRPTGVQCKCVAGFSFKQVEAEIAKAEKFAPPLDSYVVALSLPRDAVLQRQVFALSSNRAQAQKFRVRLWFWDDVSFYLSRDPAALERHYPQLFRGAASP